MRPEAFGQHRGEAGSLGTCITGCITPRIRVFPQQNVLNVEPSLTDYTGLALAVTDVRCVNYMLEAAETYCK